MYKSPEVKQILREYRKPKRYLPIVAKYPGDCFQMDIMVYNRFEYNGYKYILTCIDVFSRYAQAIAMKTNKKEELVPAVKVMFEEKMKIIPRHLNVDQELWNNKPLRDYYTQHDIKVYPSERGEINKNAIIERFHRTLAHYLMQYRLENNDENWPSYLGIVIDFYNNHINRGVGYKPIDLYTGRILLDYSPVTEYLKMKKKIPFNYKVGQYVLALTDKSQFTKGDVGNLTIYKIRDIIGRKIYLNEIRPGDGGLDEIKITRPFKPYELEPITEDTVNFILKRGIYRSQLEKKIKRQEARTERLRASYRIDNLRRRLKEKIKKAHEEGDYEKEALLQSQLDATYKRKVR